MYYKTTEVAAYDQHSPNKNNLETLEIKELLKSSGRGLVLVF